MSAVRISRHIFRGTRPPAALPASGDDELLTTIGFRLPQLEHVTHIRFARGIREHRRFQMFRRKAMANSEREQVDHFVRMRSDQMCA